MDDIDRAQEVELRDREIALAEQAHRRASTPVPVCESCEQPVHVTPSGTRWRYCVDCAETVLRRNSTP